MNLTLVVHLVESVDVHNQFVKPLRSGVLCRHRQHRGHEAHHLVGVGGEERAAGHALVEDARQDAVHVGRVGRRPREVEEHLRHATRKQLIKH